jgi:hypothetical protein
VGVREWFFVREAWPSWWHGGSWGVSRKDAQVSAKSSQNPRDAQPREPKRSSASLKMLVHLVGT